MFVDGDFWHCCPVHGRTTFNGPNSRLWYSKLERNRSQDEKATRLAEEAGWTVVRLWECSIRQDPDGAARAVLDRRTLPPATTL